MQLKLVFLSALLCFIGADCYAGNVNLYNVDDLLFQDNNGEEFVFDAENAPFSGAVIRPDENGKELTYFYKNGQKNGVAYSRFSNGKIELEITYANGKKNGNEILFREDGTEVYRKNYKDDVLNGKEIIFYDNGKPKKKTDYKNGIIEGEINHFDENGNITKVETYKNGIKNGSEKIIINGVLREDNFYVDGKLDGVSKKYNEKYLIEEINYKNGQKNGSDTIYNEDGGQIIAIYANDMKNGTYTVYDSAKNIIGQENYINGKKNGLSFVYNSNGKITSNEYFKNGNQEGISRYFDENGNLKNVRYYVNNIQMADIEVSENMILNDIYQKYLSGHLNNYTTNKNFWYQILWLGLNTNSEDIFRELGDAMKMYGGQIAEIDMYKQQNQFKYEENNRVLFLGMTPLTYLINMGADDNILRKFAINKEVVEAKDERGFTALQEAVRLNNSDVVKFLLQNDADTQKNYEDGNTILLYALQENVQPEIIETLIKYGADVNKQNDSGVSPLQLAIKKNDKEIIEILLDNKAKVNAMDKNGQPLLFLAQKHLNIVSLLLDAGADPDIAGNNGNLLLLEALKNKDDELALLLLQNKADVNKHDNSQESAVSYILTHDVEEKVFNAVMANADPFRNVAKFSMPLWKYLLENNKPLLLSDVFTKMGDITKADANREVPLYAVLDKNDEKLSEIALSHIEKADTKMLQYALTHNNKDLFAKFLTKYDLEKFTADTGETLLLYLLKNNYGLDYVRYLDQQKMQVNTVDKDRHSALFYAVENNAIDMAEYLLLSGADINGEDYLSLLKFNQEAMAKLLLSYYDKSPIRKTSMELLKLGLNNLSPSLVEKSLQYQNDIQLISDDSTPIFHYLASSIQKHQEENIDDLLSFSEQIWKIFAAHGYDINARDANGVTLLIKLAQQIANEDLFSRITDLFVELGADREIKDQYGRKAADYRNRRRAI